MKTLFALILFLALFPCSTSECVAEQFLLFNTTFTFTKAGADHLKPSPSRYHAKGNMLTGQSPYDANPGYQGLEARFELSTESSHFQRNESD